MTVKDKLRNMTDLVKRQREIDKDKRQELCKTYEKDKKPTQNHA